MKFNFWSSSILLLACLISGNVAFAQNQAGNYAKAIVPVAHIGEPVSAVGILVSRKGSEQVLKTSTSRDAHGNLVVSFPYPKSLVKSGGTATAMVVDQQGQYAFGEVVPLRPNGASALISALPGCPKKDHNLGMTAQYALLESLVEIRGQRRKLLQNKIGELLSAGLAERLHRIEAGFGLQQAEAINQDMNPAELIDRLSRVLHSVQSYQVNREQQQIQQSQAEEQARLDQDNFSGE